VELAGRAVAMWLVLLVVMMLNGVVRVLTLQPRLGEDTARQVASVIGIALVLGVSRVFVRWSGGSDGRSLLMVGTLWLALTLCFELGFGAARGSTFDAMLADYDLTAGRLWPLVLLATLFGPWLWRGSGRPG